MLSNQNYFNRSELIVNRLLSDKIQCDRNIWTHDSDRSQIFAGRYLTKITSITPFQIYFFKMKYIRHGGKYAKCGEQIFSRGSTTLVDVLFFDISFICAEQKQQEHI